METKYFTSKQSIVREIWGKADTILFIFAGAAAEFALNKAVDWLYFTGRLPKDPLGRLFSTVNYAKLIVFAEEKSAIHAIDQMNKIHGQVEENRGAKIPDWAYRDVLFMLIDYSIRAFEALERKLILAEKNEVFEVFSKVGKQMKIAGLPEDFLAWEKQRELQLKQNFEYSKYTEDLFIQYKKHLGAIHYFLLLEAQTLMAPARVRHLLNFKNKSLLIGVLPLYRLSKIFRMDYVLKELLLPKKYKKDIKALDHSTTH
ncbi:oxygenase MpaB family protein [Zunongwangia sp. HRR-M8]|uniref:oxygenase MpaB family protein n=1 Tax=Zunongwangia sp. HRR-M8 TaxID=3015170 RepID=UPI0022DD73FB|nr:oxygenase MpaB family protein [Zunongwangia sp. HRR-M8]WBL21632.1 oxygenase MpaB family protein [Zunongwangia sp. HRR-M8]